MIHPIQPSLRKTQRFGRVALTALVIGIGGAAIATVPFDNLAFAGNGNGHGGGNGGGHGHDGGKGGGNGGGAGGGQGRSHDGSGSSAKGDANDADDSTATDDSMEAHNLGKLNGFFHASPNALANASPNSAIGQISQTFKNALSDFAAANETTDTTTDPAATPPTGPSIADLGAILAKATNKTVTATQVKEIIDHLAEQNPDDAGLNGLASSADEGTFQDIADAANGNPPDESDEDSTDDTSGDTDTSDDTTVTTSATN